jgi:broad specificity phosphatase PhoE
VLILVRHGQTDANAAGLLLGRSDPALTDLGRRQAAAVALAVGSPARVLSSPLARARDTAAAIGLPVEVDDRWIELDYGRFDQVPVDDVPDELRRRWQADPELAPPGGESLSTVGRRVRSACEDLLGEAAAADVVVVSHVSPIKAAVAWALGVGEGVAFRLHLDVAGICRIAVGPARPVLHSFNDCAHLAAVPQRPGVSRRRSQR